jgi:hypothetical protein
MIGKLPVMGSISSLREPRHAICISGVMLCALAAFGDCRTVKSARLRSSAAYLIPFLQKAVYAKSPSECRGRDMSGLQLLE